MKRQKLAVRKQKLESRNRSGTVIMSWVELEFQMLSFDNFNRPEGMVLRLSGFWFECQCLPDISNISCG